MKHIDRPFTFFTDIISYYRPVCIHWLDATGYYQHGRLHREQGPAVLWNDGTQEWYFSGELHRADGPAVIKSTGEHEWRWHGDFHRVGGPAYIWLGKIEIWFEHGYIHRTDGPAVITPNYEQWWIQGIQVDFSQPHPPVASGWTQKQYLKLKLRAS